mmetsp:Transcript_13027/g.27479  ORF Transcript_13027/g.27479 Transcript_13027/m.27479 type:complete len:222 (-) Transcript_13027:156-821(-)
MASEMAKCLSEPAPPAELSITSEDTSDPMASMYTEAPKMHWPSTFTCLRYDSWGLSRSTRASATKSLLRFQLFTGVAAKLLSMGWLGCEYQKNLRCQVLSARLLVVAGPQVLMPPLLQSRDLSRTCTLVPWKANALTPCAPRPLCRAQGPASLAATKETPFLFCRSSKELWRYGFKFLRWTKGTARDCVRTLAAWMTPLSPAAASACPKSDLEAERKIDDA